jgi:hypothetical protein
MSLRTVCFAFLSYRIHYTLKLHVKESFNGILYTWDFHDNDMHLLAPHTPRSTSKCVISRKKSG